MRRFAPKTDPPLDDLERKWKQKNWLVKQRWYIYNVSKLQILAKRPNILPYNHLPKTSISKLTRIYQMLDSYQKQSCNEIELILLNNTESCSQQTSHFPLDQNPSFKITKIIKMNDLQYIPVQFSQQTFSKYAKFCNLYTTLQIFFQRFGKKNSLKIFSCVSLTKFSKHIIN